MSTETRKRLAKDTRERVSNLISYTCPRADKRGIVSTNAELAGWFPDLWLEIVTSSPSPTARLVILRCEEEWAGGQLAGQAAQQSIVLSDQVPPANETELVPVVPDSANDTAFQCAALQPRTWSGPGKDGWVTSTMACACCCNETENR